MLRIVHWCSRVAILINITRTETSPDRNGTRSITWEANASHMRSLFMPACTVRPSLARMS